MKVTSKSILKYFTSLVPLSFVLASVLLQNQYWSNSLLPINALVAMGILLYCYVKTKYINFLILSISSFAWGVGEIYWAFLEMNQIDASTDILVCSIYFITNLCLLLSFFMFTYQHSSKWNSVQLYLDSFFIGTMSILLVWIAFFNKDLIIIREMLGSGVTSMLSIIFDMILAIGVLSWLFSIRSGKVAFHDKVIFFGILLFCFIDILFYYTDFHNVYFSNSLIDFCYILSLQVIAFGVLYKVDLKKRSAYSSTTVTNIGSTNAWLYLFIFPLAVFYLKISAIEVSIKTTDILLFVILIFLYRVASKYVQLSIQNESLLLKERQMNELLEKRVEEQVAELSLLVNRDTLTPLYNRSYFYLCVDKTIGSYSPNDTLAIMIIDIDRFKTINDSFGHDMGDKVLIALSNRLLEWNQYGAVISRLSGDECAILIAGSYTKKKIQRLCTDLIRLCSEPITFGEIVINVSVSIGVALYSKEVNNRKTFMKHADIAMYRAKSLGYNKHQFYNPLFDEDFNRNSKIELLLKQIDVEKDFELYYQPQFSIPDMTLIGAEALIRWNHPIHGSIPPNIFIPIAEEVNRIIVIGKWVIQETLKQTQAWNQRYQNNLKIGFNVSVRQFIDHGFISFLKTSLDEAGINAEWLDAELTESVMITDGNKASVILKQMNKLGLTISIDDFGAGYSSLSYLNKYHFDRIKIDKSLIDQVSYDNVSGVNVVKAAISMAKAVGIKVLAEGVETQEQLKILTSLGCDEMQGYLLGRPVPADVFEKVYLE